MKSPCKDCKDRVLLCHSTCDKYNRYKEHRQKILDAKVKENNKIDFIKSEKSKLIK